MLQFVKVQSNGLRGKCTRCAFSTAGKNARISTALEFEIKRLAEGYSKRGQLMAHRLNSLEGVSCQHSWGETYVCPRVKLPPAAIAAAAQEGLNGCVFYALELLNMMDVRVTPGSILGTSHELERIPGAVHYRVNVLYREEDLNDLIMKIMTFHHEFMKMFT
jgi:alanine transaminase